MSKYYLLSFVDGFIPIVEYSDSLLGKDSINPIHLKKLKSNKWLNARKSFFSRKKPFFRICHLVDIMYQLGRYSNKSSDQLFIHEVMIKGEKYLLEDEVGHHDGVSNISFYQGKLAKNILVVKSYNLADKKNLDDVMSVGFFTNDNGCLNQDKNLEAYYEWLISNDNLNIFTYLFSRLPNYSVISRIVIENRIEFLRFILDEGVNINDSIYEIEYALKYSAKHGLKDIFELLFPYSRKKIDALYQGLLYSIEKSDKLLARFYLEKLINENGINEVVKAIYIAAAKERLNVLIDSASGYLVMLNDEQRRIMILHALACENNELLNFLNLNESELERITGSILSNININEISLKNVVKQGDIIVCKSFLEQKNIITDEIDSCLLIAAEKGFLGIVKLLIDYGAEPTTWMNYSMKFANKYNYSAMKQYFLDIGVPDERFE